MHMIYNSDTLRGGAVRRGRSTRPRADEASAVDGDVRPGTRGGYDRSTSSARKELFLEGAPLAEQFKLGRRGADRDLARPRRSSFLSGYITLRSHPVVLH
jgi:hypothetical protein